MYSNLKKFEDAKNNYETALKIKPDFVNAIVNLGNLYFEMNDFERAIEKLSKAIQIDDKNSLAHYNLGLVYQSIGNFDKSNERFEKVLKIDPSITNADKLISRSTKYTKDHPHIKKMEEKLKILKLNDIQKINIYFSLERLTKTLKIMKNLLNI